MDEHGHGRALRRALWLVPAVALLAGFGWYENRTIRTSVYRLESVRLPEAFSGLRIAQLSDLHGAVFGCENARLLAAVRGAEPDIIALTGDLADEYAPDDGLGSFLRALCEIAPVFYVTGNHEWVMPRAQRRALLALLDACGVVRLQNEYRLLRSGGESIVIAGVDDPNGPLDQKTPAQLMREVRDGAGEDAYVLMLAHRNDQLPLWAELGADTVLCGHGHGGIIRLPILGPVFGTHYELFPDDAEGVYRQGGTAQVVSRGLGQSRRIPFRLMNRPELTLVILERK